MTPMIASLFLFSSLFPLISFQFTPHQLTHSTSVLRGVQLGFNIQYSMSNSFLLTGKLETPDKPQVRESITAIKCHTQQEGT
ncbi:hypothetical protein BJ138DRAFT_1167135 [Hygrophoropsis aurantiaca]|uniref:Uncharacterized protein n=1 Tax=Hygrophoropsis aurantiaca TaxID=72124 RepID=A0ACB7ZTA7_9AGAM|nr:hypothetical protein BJ138DRAFT_1167135 [Hygrophoropsis aurantiaca]